MWRIETSDEAALMLRRSLTEHAHDADPIDWPLRTVLYARDQLRAALARDTEAALTGWSASPSSSGSMRWDVLLATILGREFDQAGVQPPRWTTGRRLHRQWVPAHPIWSAHEVRDQTPEWLKDAGIYMPAQDLETA